MELNELDSTCGVSDDELTKRFIEAVRIENEYVIENFLTNIKDKMKPLQLGSTMSSNEGGRPKEEIDSKRSESRDESIDAGE